MSAEAERSEEKDNESRPPEVVLGSILQSLRGAESARERSERVREGLHAMARTVSAVVMFALLLCLAILEIIVGSVKVGSCPVSPLIPIWLIVGGSISCVRNVVGILFTVLVSCAWFKNTLAEIDRLEQHGIAVLVQRT
ncbi:hypothetical protein ANCCAN_27497 [Ancylostoma caninum]|uniref:Uncharacterized protein n=1 Tax=Ancylostoma caninum TaxID=29170 RepID=A0A368F3V2_ANCCA|nr:hypothetical protein ANCCAN_27497 [Ancylostoma caninum]